MSGFGHGQDEKEMMMMSMAGSPHYQDIGHTT